MHLMLALKTVYDENTLQYLLLTKFSPTKSTPPEKHENKEHDEESCCSFFGAHSKVHCAAIAQILLSPAQKWIVCHFRPILACIIFVPPQVAPYERC